MWMLDVSDKELQQGWEQKESQTCRTCCKANKGKKRESATDNIIYFQ